jgi:DmsE family decaheme c-type cytochrome
VYVETISEHPNRLRLIAILIGAAFVCATAQIAFAAEQGSSVPAANGAVMNPSSNEKPAAPDAATDSSQYVGSEVCKTCHEEIYNNWGKSPHWKTTLNKRGGPSKQGCEGCHGPGKAHVEGGGDITKIFVFTKASVKTINDRCLSCHLGGPEHMNAINSVHSLNGVSCIACHSPHHAQTKLTLLIKPQPALCYSCHQDKQAEFAMPFHHRVDEGLIQCTDCHNPHGTVQPKQLRTSAQLNFICYKCHIDKQGPFVFEHEPVKIEGCTSCHVPHGGANVHMLRVSNVNLLCLQCHTNVASGAGAPGTPSFHSQESFFKSCTLCHSQIHGSNFDATFFK